MEAPTLILSDHKNLEYFTSTKKLNRRQVRWNELLANYDFKIVFRPGKYGGKPDALTRISKDKPLDEEDERTKHQHQTLLKPQQILRRVEAPSVVELCPLQESSSPRLSLENWSQHCEKDKYCQEVRKALTNPNAQRRDIQLASCIITHYSFKLNEKEYVPKTLQLSLL